jgi:excisionase family DNA binding protein
MAHPRTPSRPSPPLTADDVMTGREVARLLHSPVSTVEDWARRGVLPSVKVGRRRIFIRHFVEEAPLAESGPQPEGRGAIESQVVPTSGTHGG